MSGTKHDQGKVRMELLPPFALKDIAEVFTKGAEKYSSWNWAEGLTAERLYGAMQRHLNAWYSGENQDPEWGKSHLAHAGCCLLMLMETMKFKPELDNRHYRSIFPITEISDGLHSGVLKDEDYAP